MSNLLTESVEILFSGFPDSNVRLHLMSLGEVGRDVFVTRIACDKPAIRWSRVVLPIRMRRRELEGPKPSLDALAAPARSESEELELLQLQLGEAAFLKVRKILMKANFTTFESIPRVASVNASCFYTPKVKGVAAKDEAALITWLSWLSRNNKLVVNLQLPKARAPALPSAIRSGKTRKQRDKMIAKVLAESTRLTSAVRSHSLPIIKNPSLRSGFQGTQRGNQDLRDTCMIDGIPLQENAVTARILNALTDAAEVDKRIFLGACTMITPRDHSVKRGGNNLIPNHCRSEGTRDSDHGGSGLQGYHAQPSSKTSKEM